MRSYARAAPSFAAASATRMVLLPSLVGVALTGAMLSCVKAPAKDKAAATTSASSVEHAPAVEARACAKAAPLEVNFANLRGNSWWVETDVVANQPIALVAARVIGGEWRELPKTEWGSFASSLRAPKGSLIELRATSRCGPVAEAGPFRWPDGELSAPASGFEASFVLLRGNPWWLEVDVVTTGALANVVALLPTGERPLARTAWGSWALSAFVPPGSAVVLRARAESGEEVQSQRYHWPLEAPGAALDAGAGEGTLPARFSGVRGNRFWVEVDIGGDERLRSVFARVGDGVETPLEPMPWGSFAAALRVPIGAEVRFRAVGESGRELVSPPALWPPG